MLPPPKHGAAHVGGKDPVEILAGQRGNANHRRADPRVIDEAIHLAELLYCMVHHGFDIGLAGNIRPNEAHGSAGSRGQSPLFFCTPPRSDDVRTFCDE
jgi:hypothetical protein